jgi:hypothetical protein
MMDSREFWLGVVVGIFFVTVPFLAILSVIRSEVRLWKRIAELNIKEQLLRIKKNTP